MVSVDMVGQVAKVSVVGDGFAPVSEMSIDALHAEFAALAQRCATVASFGGNLARRYAWEPRMVEIRKELERR
jgi:hypothetical protein